MRKTPQIRRMENALTKMYGTKYYQKINKYIISQQKKNKKNNYGPQYNTQERKGLMEY